MAHTRDNGERPTGDRDRPTQTHEAATISPVHDGVGRVVNDVTVRRDVSHEREVEDALPIVGRPAPSAMPRGDATILVAEDDASLRRLLTGILSALGYRVLEARSGRDAIAVWTRHQHDIRLLLTDVVMPDGMSGWELARVLVGHNQALKVIYSSGHSADVAAQGVELIDGVNFLGKPYSPQTLAETVHRALGESR